MASVHFLKANSRWRVAWINTSGIRTFRRFTTEAEARTFAENITDERLPARPGPRAEPLTPDGIRATIASRVTVNDNGCWIWAAAGGSNGYAQMTRRINGKVTAISMHRASYEAHVGPIPDGLEIDHLCTVTRCVNPEHLEPVTQAENIRRRDARKAVSA